MILFPVPELFLATGIGKIFMVTFAFSAIKQVGFFYYFTSGQAFGIYSNSGCWTGFLSENFIAHASIMWTHMVKFEVHILNTTKKVHRLFFFFLKFISNHENPQAEFVFRQLLWSVRCAYCQNSVKVFSPLTCFIYIT